MFLAVADSISLQLVLAARRTQPEVVKTFFPPQTPFYVHPDNPASEWVRKNPGDSRAPLIASRIASQPQAAWVSDPDPDSARRSVQQTISDASAQRTLPTLVTYAIPSRDCGGFSSGGTGDLARYRAWIDNFATALGNATAIVILEPDALANAGCLPGHERSDRLSALAYAAHSLRTRDPHVRIYYDAGNSGWQDPHTMAGLLDAAGITKDGDGIAVNISNFNNTSDEVRYGRAITRMLGNPKLGMVVDTSRNGRGPAPGRLYCDPPGRTLGTPPTADTKIDGVDAFLWIKQPGQSDGCIAAPGVFVPDYAYQLAGR